MNPWYTFKKFHISYGNVHRIFRNNVNFTVVKNLAANHIFMIHIVEISYTVRNVWEFTKFLCYKGYVKFEDIYHVFDWKLRT